MGKLDDDIFADTKVIDAYKTLYGGPGENEAQGLIKKIVDEHVGRNDSKEIRDEKKKRVVHLETTGFGHTTFCGLDTRAKKYEVWPLKEWGGNILYFDGYDKRICGRCKASATKVISDSLQERFGKYTVAKKPYKRTRGRLLTADTWDDVADELDELAEFMI